MIIISITLLSHDCFSQETIKSGTAILKTLLWDGTNKRYYSNEAMFPNTRIWFKDSLIIESLKFINNSRKNDASQNVEIKSLCFVFFDVKTNKKNIYQHLSDTASVYVVPNYDNSKMGTNIWSGGDSTLNSSPIVMPDTLVNGFTYKRLQFQWGQPGKKETWIAYARCTKNPGVINLSKWASAKLGCPVCVLQKPATKDDPVGYMNEVEVLSEELSPEDIKMFNTWEKRANLPGKNN